MEKPRIGRLADAKPSVGRYQARSRWEDSLSHFGFYHQTTLTSAVSDLHYYSLEVRVIRCNNARSREAEKPDLETIRRQILAWNNRAAMAKQAEWSPCADSVREKAWLRECIGKNSGIRFQWPLNIFRPVIRCFWLESYYFCSGCKSHFIAALIPGSFLSPKGTRPCSTVKSGLSPES